jgi:hypothetical protein
MKYLKLIISLILTVLVITNCTDKFDAPDNSVDPNGQQVISDTNYIQQSPIWEGFNKPQDIIIGRETLLYIADTDNDRIVVMNIGGEILGTRNIKKPVALDQDYRLNLVVCAQFDTLINNVNSTYSAVYKIDLFESGHDIATAPIKRILPRTSFDFQRTDREYTGVSIFSDNSFYISRTGPSNNTLIDPDNIIMIFRNIKRNDGSAVDTLVGRIPLIEPVGTGLLSANKISSLTSFRGQTLDIVVTLIGDNSFKTQWLRYVNTPDFVGYRNNLEPFSTDLMTVNRFGKPEDAAIDNTNNIFVADAEKDSIFKFNSFGDELESFGGPEIFNSPHAVAFFDRTLYVADTENDRILRFILSTDID